LHLALTRPERVRKLVLVDNRGFGPPDPNFVPGLVAAKTKEELRTALLPAFHNPALLTPPALDRMFAMRQMPGAQSAMEQVYQGLEIDFANQSALHAQLPRIPHQTLVMWGRQDHVYAVGQAGRAKDIPKSRVHIFENCGHVPQVEAQPAFNSVLLDFLAQP
ncbi:MAG: alpha/beta fold hydrolase, partial [SAR324 cluster bacterium]